MSQRRDSYLAMEGHEGYYQNPVSLRIRYIKVHSGETVRISTGAKKINDAKKIVGDKLIERFSEQPNKEKLKAKGISNPLIPIVWNEILEDRKTDRHENTVVGYGVSWEYGIEPFWGTKTISTLSSKEAWTEYKKWYLKNHPERIFFNTGKHLAMLIRYAHEQGYIPKRISVPDIDLVIRSNTQIQDVGRVYTDEEYKACLKHAFSPMVKAGVICYRSLGCRKNELLKALRKNWDLSNKTAKVWSYKNKKWRTLFLPDVVVNALTEWLTQCEDSIYLFPAPTNPDKHVASQVYDKQWTKTKIAANISDAEVENAARTHDWRHTFATQTATDGWPPIVACYVLDMSLEEYQQTYTHVTIDDIMRLMVKSFGESK